jgi:hypothetical protein
MIEVAPGLTVADCPGAGNHVDAGRAHELALDDTYQLRRRRLISRCGGAPNSRLYSRLNCDTPS